MKLRSALTILAGLASMQAMPAYAQENPTVQDLADRWTESYNGANAEALVKLYSEDAEVYIHGEARLIGKDQIGQYWTADMGLENPITVLTVTDAVVDDEMRLVHGNYQVLDRTTGVGLGGGRFAHIWVLDNGKWQLDRDIWVDPGN